MLCSGCLSLGGVNLILKNTYRLCQFLLDFLKKVNVKFRSMTCTTREHIGQVPHPNNLYDRKCLLCPWFILAYQLYFPFHDIHRQSLHSLQFQNALILVLLDILYLNCTLYHLSFWYKCYNTTITFQRNKRLNVQECWAVLKKLVFLAQYTQVFEKQGKVSDLHFLLVLFYDTKDLKIKPNCGFFISFYCKFNCF